MLPALALVVVAALYRVVGVHVSGLSNFAPLMALTFCSAVYFRDWRMWVAPFLALSLSDLYVDWYHASHYGYEWSVPGALARLGCFAAALGLGWLVARRKSWLTLFLGALAGSLLFYSVTNTLSWVADAYYAKTLAGWFQAMTVGHADLPSTIFFFRNTLLSDLLFTALFASVMEAFAARRKATLARPAGASEAGR